MKIVVVFLLAVLFFSACNRSEKSSDKLIYEMNDFMAELWSLPSDSVSNYVQQMDAKMNSFSDKEKGFYYLLKTQYAKRNGNSTLQKKWALQGMRYSLTAHDDTTLIPIFMVLSDFHLQRSQYDSAVYYGHRAFQLSDSINYHLAGSSRALSNAYFGMNRFNKAKHYILIGLSDKTDSVYKGSLYTNLALNCINLNDSLGSKIYSKKAIELHRKKGNFYELCLTYGNIAIELFEMQKYQEGLILAEKAFELSNKTQIEIPINFSTYGDLLRSTNQMKKAEDAYLKSIELFKKTEDSSGMINPYTGMSFLLKEQGRWSEAISYMDTVNQLTISEYKSQLVNNIMEMEFQVRDERIESLKSQNLLEEERGKLKSWIIILIILLSLILAVLLRINFSRRNYKQRIEVMTLKQRLMRTQMTPHFIFNAISSLQGLILTEKKEKANKYLGTFAQILRGSIENSMERRVAFKNEINLIESYIKLQQVRFNWKFDFEISLNESITDLLIPPMIIQPFVENAIEHGLKPLQKKGQLTIIARRDKQSPSSIFCEIRDNGVGIESSKSTKNKKSLSTSIIREQLQLLANQTGSRAELSILSDQNGTTVKIYIPFEEHE